MDSSSENEPLCGLNIAIRKDLVENIGLKENSSLFFYKNSTDPCPLKINLNLIR